MNIYTEFCEESGYDVIFQSYTLTTNELKIVHDKCYYGVDGVFGIEKLGLKYKYLGSTPDELLITGYYEPGTYIYKIEKQEDKN